MSETPNPSGLCGCGCGQRTSLATRTDKRWQKIKGQHLRFIPGHQGRRYHDIPDDCKRCSHCKKVKPNDEFFANAREHVRTGYCKTCSTDLCQTRFRERIKRTIAVFHLRRKYGITVEDYEQLHVDQEGLCAICKRPETNRHPKGGTRLLSVDHDHATGQIRGLLCGNCNRGIALFGEDIPRLQSAIRYLSSSLP